MKPISIVVEDYCLDFEQAKALAEVLALKGHDYATLISWNDRERNVHSPQCLQCEIKGSPGWEVYGENHEGRLRISVNDDAFVFIYS